MLLVELLVLVDSDEQVPQVRDEPSDADAARSEVQAEGLFDDSDHLLDRAGHRVGVREVSGGEAGIHQVERKPDRLGAGELGLASSVDSDQKAVALVYSSA